MCYLKEREELIKIIAGDNVLLHGDDILKLVPELIVCSTCDHEHRAHKYNVYLHTLHVVNGVEKDIVLRLAALFHDIGKPYVKRKSGDKIIFWDHEEKSVILAELILKRLRFNEDVIKDVLCLIEIHDDKIHCDEDFINRIIYSISEKNFIKLLDLKTSDLLAHADGFVEVMMPALKDVKDFYSKMSVNNL